jgi:hypothetical protein
MQQPEIMEDYLIKECRERKGVVSAGIGRIFAKGFDPSADEVYWTHSLKCVPFKDEDIDKEWKACAPLCKDHFKREIELIQRFRKLGPNSCWQLCISSMQAPSRR